jgi:hypothetical protein
MNTAERRWHPPGKAHRASLCTCWIFQIPIIIAATCDANKTAATAICVRLLRRKSGLPSGKNTFEICCKSATTARF